MFTGTATSMNMNMSMSAIPSTRTRTELNSGFPTKAFGNDEKGLSFPRKREPRDFLSYNIHL